jgi:hypothetical protein
VRKSHLLLIRSRSNCLNQSIEAAKRSIYYLQCLLCNVGIENLIVLIVFAQMVGRLIAQVLMFLKVVLSNGVKTYVIKVLTQSTQLSQSQEFGLAKSAYLVFLS